MQFCFAWLAQDPYTKAVYGPKEIARAIEWFQKTHITVVNSPVDRNNIVFPLVTITAGAGGETNATLADVNYDTDEGFDQFWPTIVGPITPISYDSATGVLVFPYFEQIVVPEMLIVTKAGAELSIIDVEVDPDSDTEDGTVTITIDQTDIVHSFTNCAIKPLRPGQIVNLKSIINKESYAIQVRAQGEPVLLHWLFAIIKFCIFKYKKQYFEARGFENYTVKYGEFLEDPAWGIENVWARQITVEGNTHDFWPETVGDKVTQVIVQPRIADMESTNTPLDEQPWIGENADDPFPDFGAGDPNFVRFTVP